MAIASAYLGELPMPPSHVPDQQGDVFLRVPATGRLKELDAIFERTAGLRRPAAECEALVAYHHTKSPLSKAKGGDFDFLALRISNTMHGADTAAYLGRALRRAVMSVFGDNAPDAVHGHSKSVHVGWIPLPDVGHTYAKGRIVGVGIAIPKKMSAEKRQQLLTGLNQVRDLRLPDGRVAKLSTLLPGERIPQALKMHTWTRASTFWSTVTPVVLDRPPKKPKHSRLCHALAQSLEYAGYSKPVSIEISAFSKFNGAPPAFTVLADKPRYHATVIFSEPVAGPVIAGRLRYFGVGLFRPMFESDTGEVK
jgi:CRISPR-associated protein Csb2